VVKALNRVSLVVDRGMTFGLVGESGCGKSVTVRSMMRIVQDPGRVIAEMTSEMRLPGAKIQDSSLKRVGAGGGVVVTVDSIRLETEQLVSTDGGVTWSTESRSTLTAIDPKTGIGSEIAADYLLYDIDSGRMLARGNIISRRIGPGKESLNAESQRFELDLNDGTLLASEGLKLFSGDYQMCCGRISADLESNTVVITDTPHLADNATGRSLDAETIESDLQGTRVTARGNVQFKDPLNSLSIDAGEVAADLESGVITATGKPVVRYRDSVMQGEAITVTIGPDDLVTVEITGPQSARLNLDELESIAGEDPPQ